MLVDRIAEFVELIRLVRVRWLQSRRGGRCEETTSIDLAGGVVVVDAARLVHVGLRHRYGALVVVDVDVAVDVVVGAVVDVVVVVDAVVLVDVAVVGVVVVSRTAPITI